MADKYQLEIETLFKGDYDRLVKSLEKIVALQKEIKRLSKTNPQQAEKERIVLEKMAKQRLAEKKALEEKVKLLQNASAIEIKTIEDSTKRLQGLGKIKSIGELAAQTQLLNKDLNTLNKEIRTTGKTTDATLKAVGVLTKEKIKLQEKSAQLRREFRLEAKEMNATKGSYNALSAANSRLERRIKAISPVTKEARRELARLKSEYNKNDKALKAFDTTIGKSQRHVGNYTGALRGMLGAFGLTSGIFLFANAIKNAAGTIRDFEKSNAELAGVLNTNMAGVSGLTEDAKRLGSITAKTASEVTQLQIAYARLGFSQQEILNLTEGTINGSIALNAELGETAELTGAIVRTFGDLETQDSGKILDILTKATQKSALSFGKLQTALPIVGGAANAAGVSLTQVTALLGKLSDAGIDASSSATALRNIFIESASQGLSYEQILDKIKNSQDKLTAANDEFGKRAAVSGTVLADNINKIKELDEELQNSAGTAEDVANTQLATLDGRLKLLGSAYEGFILSIESGDGALSNATKSIVDFTAAIFENLTTINKFTALEDENLWDKIGLSIGALLGHEESQRVIQYKLTQSAKKQTEANNDLNESIKETATVTSQSTNEQIKAAEKAAKKKLEIEKQFQKDLKAAEAEEEDDGFNFAQGLIERESKALSAQNDLNQKKEQAAEDSIDKLLAMKEQEHNETLAIDKKTAEEQKALFAKRLSESQEITTQIGDAFQTASEERLSVIDQEISDQESSQRLQQSLAEQGKDNQLAFEQKKGAELRRKRAEEAKQQQQAAAGIAFYNSIAEYSKTDPKTAPLLAFKDMALAKGLQPAVEALFFWNGQENITASHGIEGKDSIPAMIAPHESVVNVKGTKKTPGLVTAMNTGDEQAIAGWFANSKYMDLVLQANQYQSNTDKLLKIPAPKSDDRLLKEVQSLNKKFDNIPRVEYKLDNLGSVIKTTTHNGIKDILHIEPTEPRL